jgi:hypothetical protein
MLTPLRRKKQAGVLQDAFGISEGVAAEVL